MKAPEGHVDFEVKHEIKPGEGYVHAQGAESRGESMRVPV